MRSKVFSTIIVGVVFVGIWVFTLLSSPFKEQYTTLETYSAVIVSFFCIVGLWFTASVIIKRLTDDSS